MSYMPSNIICSDKIKLTFVKFKQLFYFFKSTILLIINTNSKSLLTTEFVTSAKVATLSTQCAKVTTL